MRNPGLFLCSISIACLLIAAGDAWAAATAPLENRIEETQTISYPARFFAQYQPLTALDMVQQVPGFQINDGDDLRGFGGASGNVLINGRRSSSKQDLVSAYLARIPAANVDRIDLIQARTRDIDVQDHVMVVNVVLRETAPVTNRWTTFLRYSEAAPFGFGGSVSLSNRIDDIDYNIGLELARETNGIGGTVDIHDTSGRLTETRSDKKEESGPAVRGLYLNAASLLGGTLYHFNSKFSFNKSEELEVSHRVPMTPGSNPFDIHFLEKNRQPEFEIGLDGERLLHRNLLGKTILLLTRNNQRVTSSEASFDIQENRFRYREVNEKTVTTEGIARLELSWSGWADHAVKANLEGAYNVLDNTFVQTDDKGDGPVQVNVPGANSRVEENRGDLLLSDTWSLGRWGFDYGLGTEVSTIAQTGDAEQKRTFFFLKPHIVLTFSPGQRQQTRLRFAREVAQLNFNDFVSSTIFVDDDLALGNPDLKPETTWAAEISHERHFGKLGALTLTLFHHWIDDVQDLLPVTDEFEVPGNIGRGRRWGIELGGTLPLTWLNLAGARLDARMRWQDSIVTDPVTGTDRQLSAKGGFSGAPTIDLRNDNEYAVDITYRQDFQASGWAWGLGTAFQSERPLYKVNELETFNEGVELNTFIETTRWAGIKIRVEGSNLLNYLELRDRTGFSGRRGLTSIQRRERRARYPARQFMVTFSGSF